MVATNGVMALVPVMAVGTVIIVGDRLAVTLIGQVSLSWLCHPLSADPLRYGPAVAARTGGCVPRFCG